MRQSQSFFLTRLHEALIQKSFPFGSPQDLPSFDASAFSECRTPYAGRSAEARPFRTPTASAFAPSYMARPHPKIPEHDFYRGFNFDAAGIP